MMRIVLSQVALIVIIGLFDICLCNPLDTCNSQSSCLSASYEYTSDKVSVCIRHDDRSHLCDLNDHSISHACYADETIHSGRDFEMCLETSCDKEPEERFVEFVLNSFESCTHHDALRIDIHGAMRSECGPQTSTYQPHDECIGGCVHRVYYDACPESKDRDETQRRRLAAELEEDDVFDCVAQQDCLDVSMMRVGALSVQVCLSWDSTKPKCIEDEAIDRACASDRPSQTIEDWVPFVPICKMVRCGDIAQFGVGNGCSTYNGLLSADIDGISATCAYDGGFCDGGDKETCTWSFSVESECPTPSPTPQPSKNPTLGPTPNPTPIPTLSPTPIPTPNPTPVPTLSPTPIPTLNPSPHPTSNPTFEPTPNPTRSPSPQPTLSPTQNPTPIPTLNPSPQPTPDPTPLPTFVPTPNPTPRPTSTTTTTETPETEPTESMEEEEEETEEEEEEEHVPIQPANVTDPIETTFPPISSTGFFTTEDVWTTDSWDSESVDSSDFYTAE
eukprot:335255_1